MNLDVYRWTRVGHRPPSCPSVNCLYYKLDKLDLESSNSYNEIKPSPLVSALFMYYFIMFNEISETSNPLFLYD